MSTIDFLVDLWHKACRAVGEDIDMYSGLKTFVVLPIRQRERVVG